MKTYTLTVTPVSSVGGCKPSHFMLYAMPCGEGKTLSSPILTEAEYRSAMSNSSIQALQIEGSIMDGFQHEIVGQGGHPLIFTDEQLQVMGLKADS